MNQNILPFIGCAGRKLKKLKCPKCLFLFQAPSKKKMTNFPWKCDAGAMQRQKVPQFYNKYENKTGMTKKKKKHKPQNCQTTHKSNIFIKWNILLSCLSFWTKWKLVLQEKSSQNQINIRHYHPKTLKRTAYRLSY